MAWNDLSNKVGILAATLDMRYDLGDVGLLTHDSDPHSQVKRPKHMFIRDRSVPFEHTKYRIDLIGGEINCCVTVGRQDAIKILLYSSSPLSQELRILGYQIPDKGIAIGMRTGRLNGNNDVTNSHVRAVNNLIPFDNTNNIRSENILVCVQYPRLF